MGRSQGALIDAAASRQATCDCDSGYLVATQFRSRASFRHSLIETPDACAPDMRPSSGPSKEAHAQPSWWCCLARLAAIDAAIHDAVMALPPDERRARRSDNFVLSGEGPLMGLRL
jgi:hypothetical protein